MVTFILVRLLLVIKQIFSSKLAKSAMRVSLFGGLIISSLIITYLYWAFEVDLNKKLESDKSTISKYLVEALITPLQFENVSDIRKILNPFLQASLEWAVIYNSENTPIYTSGNVPDREEIETAAINKSSNIKIEAPVMSNNLFVGKIVGALKTDSLINDKRSFFIRIIFLSMVLVLFSTLVLFYVLGLILSRVMGLSEFIIKYPNMPDITLIKREEKIGDEITAIYAEFRKAFKKEEALLITLGEKTKNEAIGLQAAQIAHDIRSPLSALTMLTNSLSEISEEKRILVRSAINRITDIANSLLEKSKKQNHDLTSESVGPALENCLLAALVETIVSEKRIQLRASTNVNLEANLQESYGLFACVNITELKRVLSNLINNAAEAFGAFGGNIDIILESDSKYSKIIIKDNGKGIPKHILEKLGQQGISHGKEGTQSGSGLGVYHAKKTVESFGGIFKIDSQEGFGTSITLVLAKAKPPDWFVESLVLRTEQVVVATDDDNSVLEIWRQRLCNLQSEKSIKLITCSSGTCLRDWISSNKQEASDAIFLMDFELIGQKETGLDLIEALKISKQAILVSSRYEEKSLRARCEKMGVRLIPKAMAALVPIVLQHSKLKSDEALSNPSVSRSDLVKISSPEFSDPKTRYDLCLIDDDFELIHAVWGSVAKSNGLNIKMFSTPHEFFSYADTIDRQTPIYIDVSLKDGVKGTDVALEIHKLGFDEINLATGYNADSINTPAFIRRVVGKDFPL